SALKGYADLHAAYGRLRWSQVLQPAIELAEQGFVMNAFLSASLEKSRDRLSAFPSTARVFYPGGRVPQPGDVFRQPDLARLLKEIAARGADACYKWATPERIGRFFEDHGGSLTRAGIEGYRARWVAPISVTYRGYTVYSQPPSSSGIAVLEQLNLLEGFDLKALGRNTADSLHLVGEVMRLAIADRNRYVGDPNFV